MDKVYQSNATILNTKRTMWQQGYMFRLSLSHLQALMIQIHTKNVLWIVGSPTRERWGSHNPLYILCMDLYHEGLKMTQWESKHVTLLSHFTFCIQYCCVWLTYFIHCIQQIVSFLIPGDRRTCSPHGMGLAKSTVTIYRLCCVLGTNLWPVCYTGSYRIWRNCLVYCPKCRQYQTWTGRPYRLVRVAEGKGKAMCKCSLARPQ